MRHAMWAVAAGAAGIAGADDWPNYQGPTRDGQWREPGIVKRLPEGGPKAVWRTPVHGGYAGPAVAEGLVYVHDFDPQGQPLKKDAFEGPDVAGEERVLCLDAKTGAERWRHAYPVTYKVSYACGPRCTPTVDAGRVYALGTHGRLTCLEAKSGKLVWKKELTQEYAAPMQTWGFSGHPLVVGDLLVCTVGGPGSAVVAFDKATGAERWKAVDVPKPGYCGPVLATIAGAPTILAHLSNDVYALRPGDGKELWNVRQDRSYEMAIAPPLVRGAELLALAYDKKGLMLDLSGPAPKTTWTSDEDEARWLYPVNVPIWLDGDVLYGADAGGMFRACEWPSGKKLWETPLPTVGPSAGNNRKNGTVFAAKNGDRYYMLSETGDVIVAKLSPEKYEEIGRAPLLKPTGDSWGRKLLWSPPAFANGGIYARNDEEIVFASLRE